MTRAKLRDEMSTNESTTRIDNKEVKTVYNFRTGRKHFASTEVPKSVLTPDRGENRLRVILSGKQTGDHRNRTSCLFRNILPGVITTPYREPSMRRSGEISIENEILAAWRFWRCQFANDFSCNFHARPMPTICLVVLLHCNQSRSIVVTLENT